MNVLVVAEHRSGTLRPITLEAVRAGSQIGAVTVLLIAADPAALESELAIAGVERVLTATSRQDAFASDVYRAVTSAVAADGAFDVVIAGNTVDAMSYAAAVAIDGGRSFVTDAVELGAGQSSLTVSRSFYTGKVEAAVEAPVPALVLVRPGAFEPAPPAAAPAVEAAGVAVPEPRVRHRSYIEPASDADVDIAQERFLLAIGRGVGEQDNVPVFEELANSIGATLASSRPLVDSGWMPSSRLVGQSGKTVNPAVYLAFGISGAIQHLAGMRSSDTIIAVNHDPEASIFNVAHFGAVADIFDVAEALTKLA